MANFDDLMKEFNIKEPKKETKASAEKISTNNYGKSSSGSLNDNSMINTNQMSGVFGKKNSTNHAQSQNNIDEKYQYQNQKNKAKRDRKINWHEIEARLRDIPYAVVIFSIISVIMGLYVIINFEKVTWTLFCAIYDLITTGVVIFLVVAVVATLILLLRRRRRW